MVPRFCGHCGGPMPRRAHHKSLYCKPVCRVEGQKRADLARVNRYQRKLADATRPPKTATGAPGCGCGHCQECKMFSALQRDAQNWRARERVADD